MLVQNSLNGKIIPEIELRYVPKIKTSLLPIVLSSQDVYHLFLSSWDENKIAFVEQFKVMLLNASNRVLGICTITSGNATSTIADPKLIFALALKANAYALILAHNHPSGRLKASERDRVLTTRMKEIGNLLDIKVSDHLIITDEGFYSFVDEGEI